MFEHIFKLQNDIKDCWGSFEKQCGTSFYHKDWNIENNNIVSRRFIVKTSLDQLDKIVKNKKIHTTVSYCQVIFEFDWVVLLIGKGHFEMNMVKSFLS